MFEEDSRSAHRHRPHRRPRARAARAPARRRPPPLPPAPPPRPAPQLPQAPRPRRSRSGSSRSSRSISTTPWSTPPRPGPRTTPTSTSSIAQGKSGTDDEGEIAAIESMITQGVKAIAITPTSPNVQTALDKADGGRDQGRPDRQRHPGLDGQVLGRRHRQPRRRQARRDMAQGQPPGRCQARRPEGPARQPVPRGSRDGHARHARHRRDGRRGQPGHGLRRDQGAERRRLTS